MQARSEKCQEETYAVQQIAPYSITSSTMANNVGGNSIPSAFGVFRLMTNSYLVGACTGNSQGFSPLRIRSTYEAKRPPVSVGDFVTGIRSACSAALAASIIGTTLAPGARHRVSPWTTAIALGERADKPKRGKRET
jgi:hypothetical protein